jgi:hypothetical protein
MDDRMNRTLPGGFCFQAGQYDDRQQKNWRKESRLCDPVRQLQGLSAFC